MNSPHHHRFHLSSARAERGTRAVMWITAVTMLIEIAAGWWFNSMALLADGWHMSSHAVAIGLSATAYAAARRYASDPRFAFGTWKIEVLAGYSSAIFLLMVAVLMVVGSLERLFTPRPIRFQEAIAVAILGLAVNIVCAWILHRSQHGDEEHAHSHGAGRAGMHRSHENAHHDLNLRSAYLHVLADVATSVLAIVALVGGLLYGWAWLDPLMGIVGAALVGWWARGLIIDTGKVLLDREMDHPVVEEIRTLLETGANTASQQVTDLHVWRVGKGIYSCALTLTTADRGLTAARVREQLHAHEEIVHSTIEIHYRS